MKERGQRASTWWRTCCTHCIPSSRLQHHAYPAAGKTVEGRDKNSKMLIRLRRRNQNMLKKYRCTWKQNAVAKRSVLHIKPAISRFLNTQRYAFCGKILHLHCDKLNKHNSSPPLGNYGMLEGLPMTHKGQSCTTMHSHTISVFYTLSTLAEKEHPADNYCLLNDVETKE